MSEQPFLETIEERARERRRYLLASGWAIVATTLAVMGWGFWALAMWQLSNK